MSCSEKSFRLSRLCESADLVLLSLSVATVNEVTSCDHKPYSMLHSLPGVSDQCNSWLEVLKCIRH